MSKLKSLYRSELTAAKKQELLAKVKNLHVVFELRGTQAYARYVASGVVSDGETFTVTIGSHSEVLTARTTPSLTNDVAIAGDPVQNLVDKINALFTRSELTAAKTSATVIEVTAGGSFIGTAGNGSLRLQESAANIAASQVDGSGYSQNGLAPVRCDARACSGVTITESGTTNNLTFTRPGGSGAEYYDLADIVEVRRLRTRKWLLKLAPANAAQV